MRYPVWITKSGERIPINKMNDQHLCNALRMVKRMAQANQNKTIFNIGQMMCFLRGEMASYYAERDFDKACEADWTEFAPPVFHAMEELARKRKLEWEV